MTDPTTGRRPLLAALGSGASVLAGGCLRRARNVAGWESPQQVRLRIKTLPADADPYALELARNVAGWFRAAGVDAGVVPMAEQELLRRTLLRGEFELFLVRLPARFRDPDALVALLHSRYADAPGWQNPFGYANLDVDERLETQRRATGDERREVLETLQLSVARAQPFTLLTVPDDVRAARTAAYANWSSIDFGSPLGYLRLEPGDGGDGGDASTLRVVATDHRATTNLNPLSVEFRRSGVLTGLLYDPLGYEVGDRLRPWLADSWTVTDGPPPVARVELREGVRWHDGEPLTAHDVAFTYDLLADTTVDADGERVPIPSPRFRGRSSLVDDVVVLDDATVEMHFVDAAPRVAMRACSVPILPRHVWIERTDPASIGGIDVGPVTDALVTDNIPPVGSGPFRFVRNAPREALVLERVDDHFANRRESPADAATPGDRIPFERLAVHVVGSDDAAVGVVDGGDADVTATAVGADTVPSIGRSATLDLVVDRSERPYVLGYNTRRRHLNNPQFRRTLARLIDGEYLAETVLEGYGRPAVGPLWDTPWYPARLVWRGRDPVTPFLGTDGAVDGRRARAAFREVGYRYEDGALVGGEP
jgi:peptide/nickel transport system substrate-binding protein